MEGRKGGRKEGKAGLRIAYSNQKVDCSGWMDGWMGGWVGGWMDVKAGLRIAYSNQKS